MEKKKEDPYLIEYVINESTKAYPKTRLGQPIYDQEPAMPEELLKEYMEKEI